MKNVKRLHISCSIVLIFLCAIFTMGNKSCGNIPVEPGMPDLIAIEVGETFTISLKSNPTTGYSWQPEFDSGFLELVGSKFVSDSTPGTSPMVGVGGTEIFEFLALKQGQTRVTMIYKRPWEEQYIDKNVSLIQILPTTVKPSTVKQIADNIKQLAGQVVVINGEFRGWDVGDKVLGTPITRSDWGIRDETGTIYVTGGNGGLNSVPSGGDIGKYITLVALVKKQADSEIYFLKALEVNVK